MADASPQSDNVQVPLKTLATVVAAAIALLVAGAGGITYLIVDYIFSDGGKRDQEYYQEQFDNRFREHRQRVRETCQTNREAVELQLDALQIQINSISNRVASIKKDDDKLEAELHSHVKEYNSHVKWGRERITGEEIKKAEIEKSVERNTNRIDELYRLVRRYLGKLHNGRYSDEQIDVNLFKDKVAHLEQG